MGFAAVYQPCRYRSVKVKRHCDSICSYCGKWQPDSKTETLKNKNETRYKGEEVIESAQRQWIEAMKGEWRIKREFLKHLSKKKKVALCCFAVRFICRLNLSTEHKPTNFSPQLCTTSVRRQSIVCLQASKLNDANYLSTPREKTHFNRAWHRDIFGANKVERGFSDCPKQTGALGRQWAVDNP